MKTTFLLTITAVCLLSGCISYDYQGTVLDTPADTVQIYTDASKIDIKQYTVLGSATASGNSQSVSGNDIYAKLSSKAKECGADTILVTSYQVVPTANSHNDTVNANFDSGDSNVSWQSIGRDVDNNYGNVRGITNTSASAGSYRRIIKAQFLKRNPADTTDKK